jgi:uncharacterized coiled-coil protein SlyX
MGTTARRSVMPTDWNAQMEAASRRIAELQDKIVVQDDTLQRLSAEGADTQIVTRMLDVLKQSLERASIYKQFIETRLDRTPVRPSGQRA